MRKQDKYDGIGHDQSAASTTNGIGSHRDYSDAADNDNDKDYNDGDGDGDTEGLDALRTRIRQRIKDMQESRGYNKNKDTGNRQRAKNNNDDKNGNRLNGTSNKSKVLQTNTKNPQNPRNNNTNTSHESRGLMEDLMMTRSDGSTAIDSKAAIDTAHAVHTDIDFGNIAKTQGIKDKSVGKPGSKMKRLKRMLEEATTKRQRIEALKSGNEQDAKRAKEEQWTDVLKIAAGESVVMDTKNIKKAIKKREKMKEKSAETWKGRLERLETAKDEKMQKREENILKKQGKLKEKDIAETNTTAATGEKRKRLGGPDGKYSAAKKAAAANESPSRPGFEGKKVDFLNKKGRKG